MGTNRLVAGLAIAGVCVGGLLIAAVAGADGPAESDLQLRLWTDQGVARTGTPIPPQAVRAFAYEGTPHSVRVTDRQIAVDYGRSGVLFDRGSGKMVRRFTVADLWPTRRPEAFAPYVELHRKRRMVGPGVLDFWHPWEPRQERETLPPDVAAEVRFAGRTWRALQPAQFLRSVQRPETGWEVSWSGILNRLNEASYVEADPGGGAVPKRFTMADGLASNIVTHLVTCGDSLWAACVDIYDPQTKNWGPGGLCRYDNKTGRWQRIDRTDGRPVRWVTLLQAIGDELWVGFREGQGVAGDQVRFGMGLYPGMYRPHATAIVLARLVDGKWSTFSRKPRTEASRPNSSPTPEQPTPPTEFPVTIARLGDKAVLFSRADAHQMSGNWDVQLSGYVSMLDLRTKQWRGFRLEEDLDADELVEMIAEQGEVLVTSNRGVHRLDGKTDSWRFLDSQCALCNPVFHTAAAAGDELWLGYGRQSFGVVGTQGISRFNEQTGKWSYMSPAELGTASPIRRIVTLANGEVWVLFGERPYMGAAAGPLIYFVREQIPRPTGLGRFAGGKWKFPATEVPKPKRPAYFFGQANDLAAVDNQLVYTTGSAVYVGPKPWRQITEGEILGIVTAKDGKAVEIIRRLPRTNDPSREAYQRGLYEPAGGEVRFQDLELEDPYRYMHGDSLLAPLGPAPQNLFRVASQDRRNWVLWVPSGSSGLCYGQTCVETPAAIWLFQTSEIVRLDRKLLANRPLHPPDQN